MKKVCFFMGTPFSLGGEQRVVSIISNLLVESGYDVTIMCTDKDTPRNNKLYNLSDKVNIDYVRGYNNKYVKKIRQKRYDMYIDNLNSGKYKNNLMIQKFINCGFVMKMLLINAFNKNNFDYVISLSSTYNCMLACVSDKINAKTIGWQHSCCERYFGLKGERHYNQDKFSKYMFKKLDAYIVLTKNDQKWLKNKFNINSIVINNPKSIISNKVTDLKNKTFLAVGRFTNVKNFSMLIDMFNEYHKTNKEWKLILLGEGELKDEYVKKIKEYKLQKYIKIKKFTDNVSKYYLNSSIYLMSSLYEGWGMVLGEAIEFGLPIISFNITSASEMIKNNYSGYIIKNYDFDNYVECMHKLSENKDLLKEFSINSKKISDTMQNDDVLKLWTKLFRKVDAPKEKVLINKSYVSVEN